MTPFRNPPPRRAPARYPAASTSPDMVDAERLAHVDALTGMVGAAICATFLSSMALAPAGHAPPVPPLQIAGMAFTSLLCPVLFWASPQFYLRYRVALVLLVRLGFAYGTTHDYQDLPFGALTWPAFLVRLVYASRALVMSWGCFGWQLPFPLHAGVQLAHTAAAVALVPPTCAAPAALDGASTFMTANIAKIRALGAALDWPFAVAWPPAPMELAAATSDAAACYALVFWMQVVLGWMVPTAVLATLLAARGRQAGHWGDQHSWLLTAAAAQALWCVARVAALKYIH